MSAAIDLEPKLRKLQQAIETVVLGKSEPVKLALVALLAEGHLLIEDVPGVGKTTLARSLAQAFDCTFRRIQFTSDLLPSDILGISVFNQSEQAFEFRRGPIFANVVLADEINRTTPKTQSALLEAMSEGKISVDNQTYSLPRPFMVVATQNPIEHHGTYPLPESQLDRFMLRIRMGYPEVEAEKEILRRPNGRPSVEQIAPVLQARDILEVQQAVTEVRLDESLLDYILAIVEATRRSEFLLAGVSPRGSLALHRAAQALAYYEGRDYCIPDDIKRLALPALSHRVIVSAKYASPGKRSEEAEEILAEILQGIEIPL
ncbi:MAG: MoxR family ATPase [Acidobacteriia bacterium]|nr:MoxR family ATPase [Terriglobia bacterium]